MKILVTGAAGYIGSITINKLNEKKGLTTFGIDNLGKKKRIFKKNLNKVFIYDYSDEKKISNLIIKKKINVVIHFAANTNVLESLVYPEKFYKDFIKTKKLINICIKNGIENFFFSSSAAVYKDSKKKISENFKTQPKSPYGIAKKKIEQYLKLKANKNFKVNILRFFNVIGANEKLLAGQVKDNSSLILNLYNSAFNNRKFFLYSNNSKKNDLSPIRDYFDVNLIPEVIYKLLNLKKQSNFEIYNIGSGKGISVIEFIEKFTLISKKKINIHYKKKNNKEINESVADIKKLSKKVGNIKSNNLNTSIRLHINWLKKINA